MTDQLPERIWASASPSARGQTILSGHSWQKVKGWTEYLRADTAIPKAEADAMVAAAVKKAAKICSGLTGAKRADRPRMIRALIDASHHAALDQIVRDAVDAEMSNITNCVVCGRVIDKREPDDGGDCFGAQMFSGEWVCSTECEEAAIRAKQETSE